MSETRGFWNKSCCIPGRLEGKVAIVTGADGGLGFYITTELARRGAQVVMACLDVADGEKARKKMLEKYGSGNPKSTQEDIACAEMEKSLSPIKEEQLTIQPLNLASIASVHTFVKTFQENHTELHFLINNAGLETRRYKETEDGFEMTMGVNHLGHFLLTELLLPLLTKSTPSRIVFTSSMVHRQGQFRQPDLLMTESDFESNRAYRESKLANTTYACELARRLAGTGVVTASLHPGIISTNIANELNSFKERLMLTLLKPLSISPWQAIQTVLYIVLSPSIQSGGYYSNCTLKQPSKIAQDEKIQDWLREKSSELVKLKTDVEPKPESAAAQNE